MYALRQACVVRQKVASPSGCVAGRDRARPHWPLQQGPGKEAVLFPL